MGHLCCLADYTKFSLDELTLFEGEPRARLCCISVKLQLDGSNGFQNLSASSPLLYCGIVLTKSGSFPLDDSYDDFRNLLQFLARRFNSLNIFSNLAYS